MINNRQTKFYLILAIILFGFVYTFFNKKDDAKQEIIISLREYILSSFLAELPEINKNLPHQIDKETTLISIKFEKDKILSLYHLTSDNISVEAFNKIEPAIIKQSCEDEMKKKLLDVDVSFLNKYQNSNGNLRFEILVSKNICSKL
jgi:hypothetical protein